MLSWQFTHTGVVPPRSAVSQKTCVVPVDKVSGRTHRLHPLFTLAEVHLVRPGALGLEAVRFVAGKAARHGTVRVDGGGVENHSRSRLCQGNVPGHIATIVRRRAHALEGLALPP